MTGTNDSTGDLASGRDARTSFVSPHVPVVMGFCWGVFALIFLVMLVLPESDTGSRILGGVMFVLTAWLCVRGARARVILEPDCLVYRSPARTHKIPWAEVERAEPSDWAEHPLWPNSRHLVIRRRRRRALNVYQVGGSRRRLASSTLGRAVAAINARLTSESPGS